MTETEKKQLGRPSGYKPEYCERIIELAKKGLFLEEIAEEFEVDFVSMWRWTKTYPEFCNAYSRAKTILLGQHKRKIVDNCGNKFFQSKSLEFLIDQMTRQMKHAAVQVDDFASDKVEKSVLALLKAVEGEQIRADEFSQLMSGLMTAQNILSAEKALDKLEQIEGNK